MVRFEAEERLESLPGISDIIDIRTGFDLFNQHPEICPKPAQVVTDHSTWRRAREAGPDFDIRLEHELYVMAPQVLEREVKDIWRARIQAFVNCLRRLHEAVGDSGKRGA